jgi:hypothetical protein
LAQQSNSIAKIPLPGVLLAHEGHCTLFGALVLAALPAFGGGILRAPQLAPGRPALYDVPEVVPCGRAPNSNVGWRMSLRHRDFTERPTRKPPSWTR